MAISGTYGGTAGQITFDAVDGNVKIMSIPEGVTSVTICNLSGGTQFVSAWIPFVQRTTDGQAPTDVNYAQWATVFPPILGVPSTMTFTLRPNGIKEVWVKATHSGTMISFGASEKSLTKNHSTRRSYK